MTGGVKIALMGGVLIAAIVVFGGSDGDDGTTSADTVDYAWPFEVESGKILCEPGEAVVFEGPDGNKYAVNGMASGRAEERGYRDLDEIWRDNPDIPGTKVSVGPVIAEGIERC